MLISHAGIERVFSLVNKKNECLDRNRLDSDGTLTNYS